MPGAKGRSGGKREGAGPPVRTWTLKNGQANFILWETNPQGQRVNIGDQATIEVVDRMTLKINLSDGTIYTILRVL